MEWSVRLESEMKRWGGENSEMFGMSELNVRVWSEGG